MITEIKLQNALNSIGIEELKFCAIQYKDLTDVKSIIIADKINSKLIELMPNGEFAKFAEEKLF